MESDWNLQNELARFARLWENRRHTGTRHTAALWDERADEWAEQLQNNAARKARSARRVWETAEYLRAKGLLRPTDEVIDIGCGPGRFVAEFAKTAAHATGADLSPNMTEYGLKHAQDTGVTNVSFLACDVKEVNIDKMGWRNRFDLVFTSITPAVSGACDLDKIESMSRAYCFSSNFVRAYDTVAQAALEYALPGMRHSSMWDGRIFYSMFNLLWLKGRYPQITYFHESSEDQLSAGKPLALRITEKLPREVATEAIIDKVYRYLMEQAEEDGTLIYPTERWYGWLLWDVRDETLRDYGTHK